MKKLKSVGQCFLALALVFVLFVSLFETAHAVDGFGGGDRGGFSAPSFSLSSLFENLFIYVEAKESNDTTTANEALSVIYRYWVHDETSPFHDNGFNVVVSPDELAAIAAELTMNGFPCEVVSYGYTNAGGVYGYVWVIQGSGYMYLPGLVERDTSGAGGRPGPEYALDGRYFTIDGQWLYAEGSSSSNVLNSLYKKFVSFYDYIGDLTYLGFASVDEGIEVLNLRLQLITGYIAGFKDDPEAPSIMSKLNDLITAVENISVIGGGDVDIDFDTLPIVAKLDDIASSLSYLAGQFSYSGAAPTGRWEPITFFDYIISIEGWVSSLGQSGGSIEATAIVNAINGFKTDFDDTFSDLQQIYPTEKVEQISSGSFEWNGGVDILNSVTASDKLATTTIYRLPETTLNVTENNGTFRIDNDGNPLPVSVNLSYDNASHNLSTYGINETKTVTGTDIVIRDAYPTTPVSLKLYGQSQQNGTPTPSNPVPVYGGLEDAEPYVYMYKGSDDSHKHTIDASFVNVKTPLHGIPTTQEGNYVDENGQHWLCDVVDFNAGTYTKNVASVTFDGSSDEIWGMQQYTNYCCYVKFLPFSDVPDTSAGLSSSFVHYPLRDANGKWNDIAGQPNGTVGYSIAGYSETHWGVFFSFGHSNYTIDQLRAYLAENPITVYYACQPEVYDAYEVYGNGTLDSSYTRINMGDFVNLPIDVTYTIGNPYTALYSDVDGNWYKQRNDGSSTKITDSRVDTLNAAFNYKEYDNAADIKFNAGTNIIQVSNGDLTVDYIKGSKFFNWLYLYLSNFNGGSMDTDALLDKLDDIEDALSNMGGDIDIDNNLDFDISNDNDSYNVFYVTDPDTGEDTSIVDLTGDALTAFGRLLNFLYQIGFGDALENFGGTVDGLTDFYTDVGNGGVDVWAS